MKKNPLLILGVIAAVAAAVAIGSCSWEIPEEFVFRAQPQIWIPTGEALFDLEVSDDIIDEFNQSISSSDPNIIVNAGEKAEDEDGYDGKPLTLFAELAIATPDFPDLPPVPDFEVLQDGETDPIDLSEVSGPIPAEVEIIEVPGWAWFVPGSTPPANPVYVRLRAEWNGGAQEQYLLGTAGTGTGNFAALASSRATANTFDLTAVFNARPADLVLYFEFGANSGDVDKIASLHLRLEVPFAFHVTAPALLDFEEDDGDNPLLMEEDIFGRDPLEPDEDLDELLESLRGSSAGISMLLMHTTGLGAHLGMIDSTDPLFADPEEKKDRTNWVIDVEIQPNETEQDIDVDISDEVLDWMIDGVRPVEPPETPDKKFIPEFLVLLEEDFQINRLWELTVSEGYLRVQAVFDYNFSLEDEE